MNRISVVSILDVLLYIVLTAAYCHMIYLVIMRLPLPAYYYQSPAWKIVEIHILTRSFLIAIRSQNELRDR